MGWTSGAALLEEVIIAVRNYIPEEKKKEVFTDILHSFMDHDCDSYYDAEGIDPVFDEILDSMEGTHDDDS